MVNGKCFIPLPSPCIHLRCFSFFFSSSDFFIPVFLGGINLDSSRVRLPPLHYYTYTPLLPIPHLSLSSSARSTTEDYENGYLGIERMRNRWADGYLSFPSFSSHSHCGYRSRCPHLPIFVFFLRSFFFWLLGFSFSFSFLFFLFSFFVRSVVLSFVGCCISIFLFVLALLFFVVQAVVGMDDWLLW